MQTQEILRILRLPELSDLGQFFRSLSATTLVSMGALAAILAYWLTHRPKALQPPCNLLKQSEEVEVSRAGSVPSCEVAPEGRSQTCSLFDPQVTQKILEFPGNQPTGSAAALGKVASKMVLPPPPRTDRRQSPTLTTRKAKQVLWACRVLADREQS